MQLRGMVEALPEGMEDQPVGVEQVLQLLVNMGVAGGGTGEAGVASTTPSGEPPAETKEPPRAQEASRPDPTFLATAEGSPIARTRRIPSSISTSQIPSSSSASLLSASAATAASRRRSLMSSLSRASPTSSSKGLRKKRTFEDLSALVVAQGGRYLGVALDGPTGDGWDAGAAAADVRDVMGSKGPVRLSSRANDRWIRAHARSRIDSRAQSRRPPHAAHFPATQSARQGVRFRERTGPRKGQDAPRGGHGGKGVQGEP